MKEITFSVAKRLKKYFLFIVAICILLGLAGWFLPLEKEKTSYLSKVSILLGNYENTYLNDKDNVVQMLSNEAFYKQFLQDSWNEQERLSLMVNGSNNNQVTLTYTSHSEEESMEKLTEITDAFLQLDKQKYDQKISIIQKSVEELEINEASAETIVEKQRFLYELNNQLLEFQPAMVINNVQLKEDSRQLTARDRAILGALVGIAFGVIWIFAPEFIKAHSK